MTQLAETVTAEDELWTLDALPSTQYVAVEDETVEVRAPFPSQTYTLTGETLPPRIRVRRGVGGTTAAGHNSGSTLTPVYGLGAGEGAGSLTVDNLSDPPEEVSTLVMGATFGPEGTATVDNISANDPVTGATAIVSVQVLPELADGVATTSSQALASDDGAGTVNAYASADSGPALVSNRATSVSGTATARLDASSTTGDTESRLAVLTTDLTQVLAGVVASHVDGVGDTLEIIGGDGMGTVGGDFDPGPGDVLTYDATVGAKWMANDPLTSDGTIVISADGGANVVTLSDDGSLEHNGSGVVRLLGLPSVDPEVAGQLYTDGAPSGGVPQALMVSGGPA